MTVYQQAVSARVAQNLEHLADHFLISTKGEKEKHVFSVISNLGYELVKIILYQFL